MKDYMGDSSLAKLASIIKAALKTVSDRVRELEDTAITGVSGDGKNIVATTEGHQTTVSLSSIVSAKELHLNTGTGRLVLDGPIHFHSSPGLGVDNYSGLRKGTNGADVDILAPNRISLGSLNVATPTSDTQAATKKYVDDAVAGVGSGSQGAIKAMGETTISGGLTVRVPLTDPEPTLTTIKPGSVQLVSGVNDAVTLSAGPGMPVSKLQVNMETVAMESDLTAIETKVNTLSTLANGALQKSGGTMTGQINHGGQRATNLAAPSASTDAATKGYVDKAVSTAESVPPGIVTMFWGSTDTIPDGWVLCDGADGTPDLSDFPGYGNVDGMICYIMRSY